MYATSGLYTVLPDFIFQKFTVIPLSIFYSQEHRHLGEKYVRICFAKVCTGSIKSICQVGFAILEFQIIYYSVILLYAPILQY